MILKRAVDWRAMLPLLLVVAISTAVMFVQLRGVYIGGPLIPPILTGLVLLARRSARLTGAAIAGAWVAAAGIAYLELPRVAGRLFAGDAPAAPAKSSQQDCRTQDVWPQLRRYPAGTVMSPINLAAYFIGMTPHSVVGPGYHRNNRGTLATYRYFLGPPDRAARIAREWRVRYVAFCPGDFREGGLIDRYPDSVAAMLQAGRTPPGLERIALRGVSMQFYRVAR